MSYKKNIASNLLAQVIRIILMFLTSILVARVLGAEGRGYITFIILIFGLIASYGHFGINHATAYFQKRSNYSQKEIFNSNISILLIIFSIIASLVFILRIQSLILTDYSFDLIIIGLSYVLINFIIITIQEFYVGNERIVEINKFLLIGESFIFLTTILLSITEVLSVRNYLILFVVSSLLRMLFFVKGLGINFKFSINATLIKQEIKYGFVAYLSALFIFLNYRADQFLIKSMLGIESLGIYSIAVNLAELAFLVPMSVTSALTGRLYNINNEIEDKKFIIYSTIKYTFYIAMIVSIIGMGMTPLIPFIYGQSFSDASNITFVLFIGIIFASIGKVSYAYFITEGRPIIHTIVTAITLLCNIILNIILIPYLGMMGAALASTLSYFIYGLLYIIIFVTKEGFTIKELLVPEKKDLLLLFNVLNVVKKTR
ncbi:oligosaccharide flippase family protein [Metabacillus herbersteinensis]|uniref:Oligosaccharide flippase family protein n=1 Tax=Metabacillus herbersteinensis TaxID=283816 RepID=A0ABV6GF30_9BACI